MYGTISIYSVITCHRQAYRNWNLVNVTHYKGPCWMHMRSWLLIWVKFGMKTLFLPLLSCNFTPKLICGLWPHTCQPKWLAHTPNIYLAYLNFYPVTAVSGTYWNAESTKCVMVTRSYWIDQNGTVYSMIVK